MKRLAYMEPLSGVETITAMEFRRAPGEVFMQVALGKRFIITVHGKIVAEIHKPEKTAIELGAALRAAEARDKEGG